MMTALDAVEVLDALENAGVTPWVDGGWGVDALLRRQTRDRRDLDLALPLGDCDKALSVLGSLGFAMFEDKMPTRADLRDSRDRRVDLHPLVFDDDGNGLQQLQGGRFGTYTAPGLSGRGSIAAREVRCLSPELQLRFHTGYEHDDHDRHDVCLLCRELGLPGPDGLGTEP